jgi:PAS domain S-box-containing protein
VRHEDRTKEQLINELAKTHQRITELEAVETESRQVEAALRKERDFAESLIETAQVIVLILDAEGRIVRFNPYMASISGYRLEEVQGKDWFTTFLPQGDRTATRDLFKQALSKIPTRGNVNPIVTKSGHERQIEWYDTTLRDTNGDTIGLLAIGHDITEHERTAKELRQRVEELTALYDEVRTSRERLQILSRRLIDVQETERRHIARELHDEVGQVLTGLKLLVETSRSLPAESISSRLDQALALVDELATQVQELSLNLRPAMLDDLGLLPTLAWHFNRYTDQTNVRVNFGYIGPERRLTPEIETAAYRIVQEALTNVARHAGVDDVTVQLWLQEDALRVQVEDEGTGFDSQAAMATSASGGLSGMQERAVLLGGQLTITSAEGSGTCLIAELPLHGPPNADKLHPEAEETT